MGSLNEHLVEGRDRCVHCTSEADLREVEAVGVSECRDSLYRQADFVKEYWNEVFRYSNCIIPLSHLIVHHALMIDQQS